MPVQKCQIQGKNGHRWGKSGKCFTGKDSRKKAERQGQAIETNKSQSRMSILLQEIDKTIAKK